MRFPTEAKRTIVHQKSHFSRRASRSKTRRSQRKKETHNPRAFKPNSDGFLGPAVGFSGRLSTSSCQTLNHMEGGRGRIETRCTDESEMALILSSMNAFNDGRCCRYINGVATSVAKVATGQGVCTGGRNGLALLSPRVRVSVSAVALLIPSTPAPVFLRGHLTVTTLGLSESRSVCRLERWGALERAHSARRARAVSPAKARAGAEPVEGQHR